MPVDFMVVGAGIVGLATAYTLQRQSPTARILILEKESRVAQHQTGRNSGVIHAGVYYEPGSQKAKMCRAGLKATVEFCRAERIPFEQCGKLIVASDARETARLRELGVRAAQNGLDHSWLEAAELHALEPNIRGVAALRITDTGMVDYAAVAERLHELLLRGGAEIRFNTKVTALRETSTQVEVTTGAGALKAARIVICAGIGGDRLALSAGCELDFSLVPFRGDYYRLPAQYDGLVRHHIYPVPDPRLPFLGVHLTRLIDGGISVGPSAMLALHREGYARTSFNWRDTAQMLRFSGTWRLLARYRAAGLKEVACAVSRRFYLRQVQKYCPRIKLEDLLPYRSGIRAQAVMRDGRLAHDFIIRNTARATYVCNAPSPAATAVFPIAQVIVAQVLSH